MMTPSDGPLLGDRVAAALNTIGITSARVETWLGGPCGCDERRRKLNSLHAWTKRVLSGRMERANDYLDDIMREE